MAMSAPNGPFAAGRVTIIDDLSDPLRSPPAGGPLPGGPLPPAPPAWPAPPGPAVPSRRPPRKAMFWYLGTAGVLLAAGLVVVLVLVLNGSLGSGTGLFSGHDEQAPSDAAPPLAKLCPPPSVSATTGPVGPTPAGPRTVDTEAGISYQAYGAPWSPWPFDWSDGTLAIPYRSGQYFVTESYAAGDYLATILSGAVPATVNDGTAIDIECTGKQVAADVRVSYYPQPNTMDLMRAGTTTLGGRPAWVTEFRLHFHADGLKATDELVGLAVIDVGRPTLAVLYVSIPGTHKQWDHVVDEVLDSARPI